MLNKCYELIENVCSIESAGKDDLCFFYDKKNKDKALLIKAKACITIKELQHLVPENVILMVVEYPKNAFIKRKSLGDAIHRKVMKTFRTYMAVGGMPQAVEAFVNGKTFAQML